MSFLFLRLLRSLGSRQSTPERENNNHHTYDAKRDAARSHVSENRNQDPKNKIYPELPHAIHYSGLRYNVSMLSTSEKTAKLDALFDEMVDNQSLPFYDSANLVFGEGNVDCRVMFIGEAPGATEDLERRPFVGRGGKLLDWMLVSIGWNRADVYITNIVKRRPPENRDPLPDEIAAYKPYLTRQIEIIDPRVIVPLGRFAMNYFLPDAKITRDHGNAYIVQERIIFPVYHPAAALRSPNVRVELEADFKKLPDYLQTDIGSIL
jgi:uracil-DNA glycosylase family 4